MGVRAQHPGEARQEWCAGRHGDWELRDNRCAAIRRLGGTGGVWLTPLRCSATGPNCLLSTCLIDNRAFVGEGCIILVRPPPPPPTNKKSRVRMSVS